MYIILDCEQQLRGPSTFVSQPSSATNKDQKQTGQPAFTPEEIHQTKKADHQAVAKILPHFLFFRNRHKLEMVKSWFKLWVMLVNTVYLRTLHERFS